MSFIANLQLIRITPACAGTTSVFLSPRISTWDHPRVCGNHLLIIVAIIAVMGSPPRVREPLEYERRADGRDGITPACAGTTSTCLRPSGNRRDHPRVCGNHPTASCRVMPFAGSPPRVREPLFNVDNMRSETRITPACAGTTSKLISASLILRDHPRVCGNHGQYRRGLRRQRGSPPRVREPPRHFCDR